MAVSSYSTYSDYSIISLILIVIMAVILIVMIIIIQAASQYRRAVWGCCLEAWCDQGWVLLNVIIISAIITIIIQQIENTDNNDSQIEKNNVNDNHY